MHCVGLWFKYFKIKGHVVKVTFSSKTANKKQYKVKKKQQLNTTYVLLSKWKERETWKPIRARVFQTCDLGEKQNSSFFSFCMHFSVLLLTLQLSIYVPTPTLFISYAFICGMINLRNILFYNAMTMHLKETVRTCTRIGKTYNFTIAVFVKSL